ncbi:MAG: arsenate reductase ArsC [Pseudomonadota bacterium]
MLTVLFLCTGNSCRSVMAEGILNHHGSGRFRAFSAGSFPTGEINPASLARLKTHGMKSDGYESKSWDRFVGGDQINIVITVCDNAAGEVCPIFPGAPVKAHWGVPDPAHFEGTPDEVEAEFERVFNMLEQRIEALIRLPVETMDKVSLATSLNRIGNT